MSVRAQSIAVLCAVFVAGAFAGAAIEHVRGRRAGVISLQTVPPERVIENMKFAGTGVPVLYESLGLSEEQRDRIRAIMAASRPKTDSLLRETWPALRVLLDSLRSDIEQVLTAQQRARLADMRRGTLPTK